MSKKELIKRYIFCVLGLFFSGVGVAFTRHGSLGVSPISSVANVMSLKFTFFTMGNWLIVWNCILILGQILILRKEFKLYQLLQIPLSFLFGWFTDLGMKMVSGIPVPNYAVKLILLLTGILLVAFGVVLSVIANVIMNSGEALVKAVSDKSGKEFGSVKVIFDVSCVIAAVILSLILFKGSVVGTREGTIITALCTGFVVRFFTRFIKKPVEGFLKK